MSQQPEAQFWSTLKRSLPKHWFVNRIENRMGGGVPDLYICIDGKSFWLELKVTKSHRVNVSPNQIAWHYSFNRSQGASFFLVKTLPSSTLFLFEGTHGRGLAEHGVKFGVQDSGSSGSGSSGSGSSGSGSSGSGSQTVVPCAWSGDTYKGLIDYLNLS